jgi:hypothetical protein
MTTDRKASCVVPRYRAEFALRRPSFRARKLPAIVLGITVGITSFAAVAGSFTLETGQSPQTVSKAVASERTPRSVIETRFVIVPTPAADNVAKRRPQAQDACDDLAFRFLNSQRCSDSPGKHIALTHRAAIVVIAHSGAPSADLDQSQACEAGLPDSREHCRLD